MENTCSYCWTIFGKTRIPGYAWMETAVSLREEAIGKGVPYVYRDPRCTDQVQLGQAGWAEFLDEMPEYFRIQWISPEA